MKTKAKQKTRAPWNICSNWLTHLFCFKVVSLNVFNLAATVINNNKNPPAEGEINQIIKTVVADSRQQTEINLNIVFLPYKLICNEETQKHNDDEDTP